MRRRDHGFKAGSTVGALLAAGMMLAGCGGSSGTNGGTAPDGPSAAVPAAVAAARKADTPVDPAMVAADNAFGVSLFDTLLSGSNQGNLAISPLSVSLALQVLYNGAGGSTQAAMSQTLDLGSLTDQELNNDNAALQASLISADPEVQLTIANSLWIKQGTGSVVPTFTQTDESYYGATVGALAGAPADVNAWASAATDGLITELLSPAEYSGAIVANVLYFKGLWSSAFDPGKTITGPFTLADGSETTAPLMYQSATFPYTAGTLHGAAFQAVRLSYGQEGRFSMLIILPDAGADITTFVSDIAVADLNGLTARLGPSPVNLTLPRFTASYGASLTGALTSMGMGAAFAPSADFSALAPGFMLNFVVHKTVIEVDETGTVATAATGGGDISAVQLPFTMTVNHPFFYAIQDGKSGDLLFVGVLMNPQSP